MNEEIFNKILNVLENGNFHKEDDSIIVTLNNIKLNYKESDNFHYEEKTPSKKMVNEFKEFILQMDDDLFEEVNKEYSKHRDLNKFDSLLKEGDSEYLEKEIEFYKKLYGLVILKKRSYNLLNDVEDFITLCENKDLTNDDWFIDFEDKLNALSVKH